METITHLDLAGNEITDIPIFSKVWPKLQVLKINFKDGTVIPDHTFEGLSSLTELEVGSVGSTLNLEEVASLPLLKKLYLDGLELDAAEVEDGKHFKNLEVLNLGVKKTKMLSWICYCKNLQTLILNCIDKPQPIPVDIHKLSSLNHVSLHNILSESPITKLLERNSLMSININNTWWKKGYTEIDL